MEKGTLISRYHARAALQKHGRIPALDGLRAFFVFSVLAFHLWQQSWLTPTFSVFGEHISLYSYLRTGYLWVDGMLLLSSFLLFLPLARSKAGGRAALVQPGFFKRRFVRIMPTYLLHLVVVFFVVALPQRRYATFVHGLLDWLAHLSFTHPLFAFSNMHTPLNGALWTIGVEVQFYLLFPFLSRAFLKMPLLTWGSCALVAFLFRGYAISLPDATMWVNQLPAFLDVYLNGFVLAQVYALMEKRTRDEGYSRVMMSAVLFSAVLGLASLVNQQAAIREMVDIRRRQMMIRFTQSVLTSLVILGLSFGLGGIRLIMGNKVTGYLAAISYQVYMWHQVIALQLRVWGVPGSVHQEPHLVGELSWQQSYLGLVLGLTFIISTFITYAIERPLIKRAFSKPSNR